MNTATITFVQKDIFGEHFEEQKTVPAQPRVARMDDGSETRGKPFTSPQTQFLFRAEKALGLERKISGGKPVLDSRGMPLLYRSKKKVFNGVYKSGELSSLAKQGMMILCQQKALSKLSHFFEEREYERLLYEGLTLLTMRLRMMGPDECPLEITEVFIEHYAQQDFMSNERTGETIRNNRKRAGASARRLAAGIKPRNLRAVKSVGGGNVETPAQKADKPYLISVDRLLAAISSKPATQDDEEGDEL